MQFTTLHDQLIFHEGLKLKPYRCTAGKLTIGVGRNLDDKGISETEALFLLENDLEACRKDLLSIFGVTNFNVLSEGRRRALIDLRFNVGPWGFRGFKKMIEAVQQNNWQEAANQLRDSVWWKQVQATRAELIYNQLLTGNI